MKGSRSNHSTEQSFQSKETSYDLSGSSFGERAIWIEGKLQIILMGVAKSVSELLVEFFADA